MKHAQSAQHKGKVSKEVKRKKKENKKINKTHRQNPILPDPPSHLSPLSFHSISIPEEKKETWKAKKPKPPPCSHKTRAKKSERSKK